ncbi:hypothetical protein [Sphingobium olei]|uniref:Uncharacterized protein n=1 Tax=Sphingobium olei TaxID=420955 RepID=A0ABW3NWT5_9SPHN|nr:hypothetical protein [Sphingobium sp.]
MSRDRIEVRECDRCKAKVEARELDAFARWGSGTITGEREGRPVGFANADFCPDCLDFIVSWFGQVMRERDEKRTVSAPTRAPRPPAKEIAAKLIADNIARSPELDDYLARLDAITSLDDLQEYQASNGLRLIEWLADPALSERVQAAHYAAFERLENPLQDEEQADV